ncbi:MAG: phage tail protein [Burkholderiaceae bacterium]|nr:MAG: phage tail protein [Burkholderiaceae bacterium]
MSIKDDEVEVLIGGLAHRGWERYDIDSDLMTPADAWHVELAQTEIKLPPSVDIGAGVQVRVGGQTVLSGLLDEREHSVSKRGHTLMLSGRDAAGVLIDCSAPIFGAQKLTLEQVVANIVRPLGFTKFNISAEKLLMREKVNVEPGDTAWDALKHAAEANGLWPWIDPDGTLVVGGPDYNTPVVDTLVMRYDGKGNNIEQATEKRSQVPRHSKLTVLGQAHAVGLNDGRNNVKGEAEDTGIKTYRPKIVVDFEAISNAIASARAFKLMGDARVMGYELRLVVKGHRTAGGALWTPGQRVAVRCEPLGLDGVYFVMSRRLSGDRNNGQQTHLTLREDGVWALYAHPHARKHRRGKNMAPGKVFDPVGTAH